MSEGKKQELQGDQRKKRSLLTERVEIPCVEVVRMMMNLEEWAFCLWTDRLKGYRKENNLFGE